MQVLVYFVELLKVVFTHSDSVMKGALLLLILLGFMIGFGVGLLVCSLARKRSRD